MKLMYYYKECKFISVSNLLYVFFLCVVGIVRHGRRFQTFTNLHVWKKEPILQNSIQVSKNTIR
jgi:hypothetical protein